MCDAQEDSADVTLQPGAGPQLLLGQAGHKPEILSLHLRIGFKEPEDLRMRVFVRQTEFIGSKTYMTNILPP